MFNIPESLFNFPESVFSFVRNRCSTSSEIRTDDAGGAPRLVGAFKRRVEDTALRIPKSTTIRQNLHAVRRAAGPTGRSAPLLVATDFTDRHADRFWAAGRACAGAETQPAVYALHRVDNQTDLPGRPSLGRPGPSGGGGRTGRCS